MILTNFKVNFEQAGLDFNGQFLDLHNNFDFRDYHHDITSNQLQLTWTRSHEDWSKETICGFKLVFRSLTFLKIRGHDYSTPYKEVFNLSDIGFLTPDLRNDFDSFLESKNITDKDDLNICFQSDLAFKIGCNYADLVELNEEIIYVQIINEAVPVWRPLWADRLKENVYRIKSFAVFDPNDEFEELEFKPDEIVICERQKKSEGHCLVAIKKSTND
jgi:hypothetical protein